jgi:DNA replication factor GINS
MYSELYDIWKRELQSVELEKLSPDFYSRIANYLREIREENRMLDKRTAKARLLKNETQNVKRMLYELTRSRYRKLTGKAIAGEKIASEILTVEEEKLMVGFLPLTEAYQTFARNLLHGHLLQMNVERQGENVVLRFLKDIPEIIGADVKPYGPFKIEDVASLPSDNAKILIKQGLAEKIEAN